MRKLYLCTIGILLVLPVFLLCGCNGVLSDKNLKCYGKLVEYKGLAENTVKSAKEGIADSQALKKAQILYEKTAAKGNALIEIMKMAVKNRKPSTDFDQDIKEVEIALNEFSGYVSSQATYKKIKAASIPVAQIDIADAAIKIIDALWRNHQEEINKRIAEIASEMDNKHWLDWRDIK